MKRFLVSVILFAAFLAVLLLFSVFCLPDQYICNSMLGVERDKLTQLESLNGPRIIFVGGSNVGNGFDSGVIEETFHRPVMNMGLHAGLGLIYQMQSIKDLVHTGDLVVIMPEYEQFTDACYGDEELLAMVSAIIPGHRKLLDHRHWRMLFSYLPRYGARKLLRLKSLWSSPRPSVGYDEHGDSIGWRKNRKRFPFASVTKQRSADLFTGEVVPYLNDFVSCCQSKDAKVCLVPPVLERTSYEHEKSFVDEVARQLKLNGTPFVTTPDQFVFPDDNFADTHYHLNGKGVPERMRILCEVLRSHTSRR